MYQFFRLFFRTTIGLDLGFDAGPHHMDGWAEARRRTPYRLPCRTISGSSSESPPTASQCRNRSDIPDRAHHAAVRTAVFTAAKSSSNESNLRHPHLNAGLLADNAVEYGFGTSTRTTAEPLPSAILSTLARSIYSFSSRVRHSFCTSRIFSVGGGCANAVNAVLHRMMQRQSTDITRKDKTNPRRPEIHTAPLQNIRNAALIQFKTVHRNRCNPVLRLQLVAYIFCAASPFGSDEFTSVRETACRVTAVLQLRVFLPG